MRCVCLTATDRTLRPCRRDRVHGGSIKGQPKVHRPGGPGGISRCRLRGASPGIPGTRSVERTGRQWPTTRRQLGTAGHRASLYVAEPLEGSGYPYRRFWPRPVRYTSATTLTRRTTAARNETRQDKRKTARIAETSQLMGRFRRWWQVLGSNQRRLSRRFYRPLPLATRATCRCRQNWRHPEG